MWSLELVQNQYGGGAVIWEEEMNILYLAIIQDFPRSYTLLVMEQRLEVNQPGLITSLQSYISCVVDGYPPGYVE